MWIPFVVMLIITLIVWAAPYLSLLFTASAVVNDDENKTIGGVVVTILFAFARVPMVIATIIVLIVTLVNIYG